MKWRLTLRATQDLIEIADFVRERNPQGALRVRAVILACLRTLALFPKAGRQQGVPGVRKLVTHRYGYLIYYCVVRLIVRTPT